MTESSSSTPSADNELDQIRALLNNHKDEAIVRCERLIQRARAERDTDTQLAAAELYGLVKNFEGRNLLFEALQLAQAVHAFAAEARLSEQIARSYYTTGDYRLALQYWTRCVELSDEQGGEVQTWIFGKVGLGQVHDALGNHAQAVNQHRAALSRMTELDDPYLDAKIRINLAVNLAPLGATLEAKVLLSEALTLCLEHYLLDYAAEARYRLGEIELNDGDLANAAVDLAEARSLAQQINYVWAEVGIVTLQAEVQARQQQAAAALVTVNEGIALAERSDYQHHLQKLHAAAARYAEMIGDVALAYRHLQAHVRYQGALGKATQPVTQAADGLLPSASRRLAELASNPELEQSQPDAARSTILGEAVSILTVAAASVWRLDDGGDTLRCVDAHGTSRPVRECTWTRARFPALFAWLDHPTPLVAHDAIHHRHTWELAAEELRLRGIKSLLAWPIRAGGRVRAILLVEHCGSQRNWTPDDCLFGGLLADLMNRVQVNAERQSLEAALANLQTELQSANRLLAEHAKATPPSTPTSATASAAMRAALGHLARADEMLQGGQHLAALAQSVETPLATAQSATASLVRQLHAVDIELELGQQRTIVLRDVLVSCRRTSQMVQHQLDRIENALHEFRQEARPVR
ncbi:GAF domain-containing protein [Andreprevotia chitinilytica]|uniref:GAF domain-containing protein n=1 Tax=Andreprevotia chitinilytica TaxID=396808 RepID=UPI0005549171|nr:GAF domain-containing protein [Andreprevotia chitinilytica]